MQILKQIFMRLLEKFAYAVRKFLDCFQAGIQIANKDPDNKYGDYSILNYVLLIPLCVSEKPFDTRNTGKHDS